MSAEALVGAALCGLSGWALGQLVGATVVTVRRGVRWASFSRLGRSRAGGGNGCTAYISTAGCPWCASCGCSKRADGPEGSVLEAVPTGCSVSFGERNSSIGQQG